jgi:hypothetical protein
MTDGHSPEQNAEDVVLVPLNPAADAFYAGAYRRIQTVIIALSIAGSVPMFVVYGWRVAGGFLLGALLAYLNFVWLKQSIIALTDRVSQVPANAENAPQSRAPGGAIVFKFLFRYLAIATVGYVIISSSSLNVLGLIAGFFLSVVALLFEAVSEVVYALRHGD